MKTRTILALLTLLGVTAGFLSGPADARVPFPHDKHAAAGAACADCHGKATSSDAGTENLVPEASACGSCHEPADLDLWGYAAIPAAPVRIARFSHVKHLALTNGDCAHCHGALLDPNLVGTGKSEPSHALCLTCHDGKQASDDCTACHVNVAELRPRDHGVDYLHTHQFSARGMVEQCEDCHRHSETCSECHTGDNVLFMTHPRNYFFTHAQDARKHDADCASCHEIDTFCNDCHAGQGIEPTNHDDEWVGGANRHATEARRDIMICASCHESGDPVCTNCHRDSNAGKGNDTNIHQDGFDDYGVEGPWHEDDAYYCFDCHTKSTSADGFCGYCHNPRQGD